MTYGGSRRPDLAARLRRSQRALKGRLERPETALALLRAVHDTLDPETIGGLVVELADELPAADIVTLDSVICCYPYLAALLRAAIRPGPRLVGLTYPHDSWWMRLYMRLYNVRSALHRWPDHYFIHRRSDVDRLLGDAGFLPIHDGGTRTWRVIVYRR